MVKWWKESKTAKMYIQREIRIFREVVLLRSSFARLVEGYLKAPNHFRFSSLLYFHKSRQLRLFSISQLWAVWRKARTKSGIKSTLLLVFFVTRIVSVLESKSSLAYIISQTLTCGHASCIAYHLLNEDFHFGNPCVKFSLGNRYNSCYTTPAIYAACPK